MRSIRNSNNRDNKAIENVESRGSNFSLEEELSQFSESEITSDDIGDFGVGRMEHLGDIDNS